MNCTSVGPDGDVCEETSDHHYHRHGQEMWVDVLEPPDREDYGLSDEEYDEAFNLWVEEITGESVQQIWAEAAELVGENS